MKPKTKPQRTTLPGYAITASRGSIFLQVPIGGKFTCIHTLTPAIARKLHAELGKILRLHR